jgi:ubiquinone biosynthesis accessory factor UbiK
MIRTAIMNAKFIDELNARIVSFLQHTPAGDVGQNLKGMLSSSLAKLDLVTREEFDLQAQVLARTRERLTALEARVEAIERPDAGL